MLYCDYNEQENNDKNAINRQAWRKMYKSFGKCNPISLEEERQLLAEIEEGRANLDTVNAQINKLIMANVKFVASIAKRYATSQFPLEDLVQEGILGLREAVVRFRPIDNNKLITFARYEIQGRIISYLNSNKGQVKIPTSSALDKAIYTPIEDTYLMQKEDLDSLKELSAMELKDTISKYLCKLPELERSAIHYKFGFDGGPMRNKKSTANCLELPEGVTINDVLQSAFTRLKILARNDF